MCNRKVQGANSAETELTPEELQGSRTIMERKKNPCVHVAHPLIHGTFTFNCPIIVFSERELLPDYSCDVNSNEVEGDVIQV